MNKMHLGIIFAAMLFFGCSDDSSSFATGNNPEYAADTITIIDTVTVPKIDTLEIVKIDTLVDTLKIVDSRIDTLLKTDTIVKKDTLIKIDTIAENLRYLEAIQALDWGKNVTYVVGHKFPDQDAIFSAIAYAELMRKIGYNVEARRAGDLNAATKFIAEKFEIELPEELVDATGSQLILVDHNDYPQSVNGAANARILQIIDHHSIGDVSETNLAYEKIFPVGSTCTIVYTSYRELGVEIDKDMAKVMLAGIVSDTKMLTKITSTAMDSLAYNELLRIAGVSETIQDIYSEMKLIEKSYDGMTDLEIFNSDPKDYVTSDQDEVSYSYRIASIDWYDAESIDTFLDRMLAVMKTVLEENDMDMVFAKVDKHVFDETIGDFADAGTFVLYYGKTSMAKDLVEEKFGNLEREGVYYSEEPLNRKLAIAPKIVEYIKEYTAK